MSVYLDLWNGMKAVFVKNMYADAVVVLNGAHVVSYVPKDGRELLWISEKSWTEEGKPIRGGIPVCWPWFGPVQQPPHGFARISHWKFEGTSGTAFGESILKFSLENSPAPYDKLAAELTVKVGLKLEVSLTTHNRGTEPVELTEALHSYFSIADIQNVRVSGLDGESYLDKKGGGAVRRTQSGDIEFTEETDRLYDNTTGQTVIHDLTGKRKITVTKSGSRATVVWNPWIDKSKAMPDFGDEEYHGMVCVETANAGDAALTLAPGDSNTMTTVISA